MRRRVSSRATRSSPRCASRPRSRPRRTSRRAPRRRPRRSAPARGHEAVTKRVRRGVTGLVASEKAGHAARAPRRHGVPARVCLPQPLLWSASLAPRASHPPPPSMLWPAPDQSKQDATNQTKPNQTKSCHTAQHTVGCGTRRTRPSWARARTRRCCTTGTRARPTTARCAGAGRASPRCLSASRLRARLFNIQRAKYHIGYALLQSQFISPSLSGQRRRHHPFGHGLRVCPAPRAPARCPRSPSRGTPSGHCAQILLLRVRHHVLLPREREVLPGPARGLNPSPRHARTSPSFGLLSFDERKIRFMTNSHKSTCVSLLPFPPRMPPPHRPAPRGDRCTRRCSIACGRSRRA